MALRRTRLLDPLRPAVEAQTQNNMNLLATDDMLRATVTREMTIPISMRREGKCMATEEQEERDTPKDTNSRPLDMEINMTIKTNPMTT